ncbi:FAA hydrolase family protein [Cohnella endophytica]|uniref:FAA hydrolase family protein n=1 Tax=Cohnella endophytica TaxID=2419778 RepID=A0A494XBC5_9BACL|nr:fumarylacetoacetate hydrolase family protein [Cohnella endophytica]RKP45419.1 FAA hydrolase family protein [Cohnella endophytica]
MKLLSMAKQKRWSLGIASDKGVLDVEAAAGVLCPDTYVPLSTMETVRGGAEALGRLERLLLLALESKDDRIWLKEEDVEWGTCVTEPNKIICIGLNYRKHAEETNSPIPPFPILFNKFNNAITSHDSEVAIPMTTAKLDYEAELAVVIGKRAKYVPVDRALEFVFGYCAANDLSARDLQMRTSQWLAGKSGDRFLPIGPYLVTADEVGDPQALNIRSYVNGEERQNSNTGDMIFGVAELISDISSIFTLEPGDIILTGTPEGVVMGYPPEKQIYLQPGDLVTVTIDKLGSLRNRMVAERP